jgi:hypothetical protein
MTTTVHAERPRTLRNDLVDQARLLRFLAAASPWRAAALVLVMLGETAAAGGSLLGLGQVVGGLADVVQDGRTTDRLLRGVVLLGASLLATPLLGALSSVLTAQLDARVRQRRALHLARILLSPAGIHHLDDASASARATQLLENSRTWQILGATQNASATVASRLTGIAPLVIVAAWHPLAALSLLALALVVSRVWVLYLGHLLDTTSGSDLSEEQQRTRYAFRVAAGESTAREVRLFGMLPWLRPRLAGHERGTPLFTADVPLTRAADGVALVSAAALVAVVLIAVGQALAVPELHARPGTAQRPLAHGDADAGQHAQVAVVDHGQRAGVAPFVAHPGPFAEQPGGAEVVGAAQVQRADLFCAGTRRAQGVLAIAQRHVGRSPGPAQADARVAAPLAVVLGEGIHGLPVDAAQAGRQEVADGIARAQIGVRACRQPAAEQASRGQRAGDGQVAVDHGDQVGAHAVDAEGVEGPVVEKGRRMVPAHAQLAQAPGQADGGAPAEVERAAARVVGHGRLQPQAGHEAAAQVFLGAQADTAGQAARRRQRPGALACRARGPRVPGLAAHAVAADAGIHHAEQRDRGGRLCGGRARKAQQAQCVQAGGRGMEAGHGGLLFIVVSGAVLRRETTLGKPGLCPLAVRARRCAFRASPGLSRCRPLRVRHPQCRRRGGTPGGAAAPCSPGLPAGAQGTSTVAPVVRRDSSALCASAASASAKLCWGSLAMRPASTWSNSSRAISSMWARGCM